MKLTEEQAQALLWEEYDDEFTVEESSDWVHLHKGQRMTVIFSYDGKFYRLVAGRTGSEFTDWYYDFALDCPEVEKREVTKHIWETVS